jgi:hypothetical protein
MDLFLIVTTRKTGIEIPISWDKWRIYIILIFHGTLNVTVTLSHKKHLFQNWIFCRVKLSFSNLQITSKFWASRGAYCIRFQRRFEITNFKKMGTDFIGSSKMSHLVENVFLIILRPTIFLFDFFSRKLSVRWRTNYK